MRGRAPRLFQRDEAITPNISPDGNHPAYLVPEKRIRITDLHARPETEILVPGAEHLGSLDWTADGSGFFSRDLRAGGETRLLHIERSGASEVLWTGSGTYGIPSPDGRNPATFRGTSTTNVWMFEEP